MKCKKCGGEGYHKMSCHPSKGPNQLDRDYQDLLEDILRNGQHKSDRTGTGTISVFGRQIRHNMQNGFPLLTTKKMHYGSIVTELNWFLSGDTNIKYLVDNGCNIWNGDAYKRYKTSNPDFLSNDEMFQTKDRPAKTYRFFTQEEFINKIKTDDQFAKKWGGLGPIYGKQWREWKTEVAVPTTLRIDDGDDIEQLYVKGTKYIDQIENLINDLKTNPDSRRLMVNAWNVGELDQMVLPPCHYGFQVYTRLGRDGKRYISLMWNQRSVDTFLGLPFNIASYGLLLCKIANEVDMIPDELIGNLGDTHLYLNHIDQAKEQISRDPFELPTLSFDGDKFNLMNYQCHPAIKAPLSN